MTGANITLRDYQQKAVNEILGAFGRGVRGIFAVLPTGAGKTVIFTEVIKTFISDAKGVAVVAHRRELIDQASKTIMANDMHCGIIRACNSTFPLAPIQVCSIDSMRTRELPWAPDLIILDEAHLSKANRYKDFLDRYPDAKLLLVSATPKRKDGSGFSDLAEKMVLGPSIQELIDHPEGPFLVPPVMFTGSDLGDLDKKVKVTAGDYNQGDLQRHMSGVKLVGDIVEMYLKHAAGRKGVVFCSGVKHSQLVADQFNAHGVRAEHLDGSMSDEVRKAIIGRLKNGETTIVTNDSVLCEGWDETSISYVGLAKPTKSEALYIQMAGRGIRIHPGKSDCVINDHGANVARHGHLLEYRQWSLKGSKGVRQRPDLEPYYECRSCGNWFPHTLLECPSCGWAKPVRLVEVNTAPLEKAEKKEAEHPILRDYRRLLKYARDKGYKAGWAYFKLLEKNSDTDISSVINYSTSRRYEKLYYFNK